MLPKKLARYALPALIAFSLASCSSVPWPFGGDDEGGGERLNLAVPEEEQNEETIWDLFGDQDNPNVTLEVNKYIWNASLEILDFLPVETLDPFSGVIVTGWGSPPGSTKSYKATVYVQDPALDARSLRLALLTQTGPADPDTVRQIEDAILTRARQLRIRDKNL
ncbi:MAG: DUF3576 domain-containing protein [Albidovulum sp.]|nr:DUF3576 domain-containing protein [Albidovulum sp.]MDE0308034.1 DUF3576 domain-containing protein [Albidovulum sp.]MDE0533261.1 DUF3576 domain-containing protein [Albidovulum sp.]